MQPINFVKTVPLKKYKATRIWLLFSSVFFIAFMIALTIIHYHQRTLYKQLSYEKTFFLKKITGLDTITRHASAKKEEHQHLQDKLKAIAIYSQHMHNHLQFLTLLGHALHNGTHLHSMNTHDQLIELKIVADTSDLIFKLCDTIGTKAPQVPLSIAGLELIDNKVLATFKINR